jgi:hypothetical protein
MQAKSGTNRILSDIYLIVRADRIAAGGRMAAASKQ